MAELGSVNNWAQKFTGHSLSLTDCCSCRSQLRDPVMLQCLHHCCRSCLESSSAESQASKSSVECAVCCETTELSTVTANGILRAYDAMSALRSDAEMFCRACEVEPDMAEFWCADCCMGLCASCYSLHNRFSRRHRSAELEVARTWSFSQFAPPAVQCSLHKQQPTVQCFTCREPKCLACHDGCRAASHTSHRLSHDEIRKYIAAVLESLRVSTERLNRLLLGLHEKRRSIASSTPGFYKIGHKRMVHHKRSLQDTILKTFDTFVNEVRVNLRRIRHDCTPVVARPMLLNEMAIAVARYAEVFSVTGVCNLHMLRERNLLKKVALSCASSCTASRLRLLESVKKSGVFVVDTSVPQTAQIVLSACLGDTNNRFAAPPAPLLFDQASVSFQTPVACYDLAVTSEGHVLLAAMEHGLLVYSDHGQQLSGWRPTKLSDGLDDEVISLAALRDEERVVVGVFWAQLVVLLRRSVPDNSWLEDRRVTVLQSFPWRLAVHGDLLAVTEWKRIKGSGILVPSSVAELRRMTCRQPIQDFDTKRKQRSVYLQGRPDSDRLGSGGGEQLQLFPTQAPNSWAYGNHVRLMTLGSGQLLHTQSREYDIDSVALTALCVVTTSCRRLRRNTGLRPWLVDAHSHAGDFLWRYETRDEELALGVCSAATWSRVYAAMWRVDHSCKVTAIAGADGRDRRDVISSSTHGLQYPAYLSLARGEQRTVLAVLSYDEPADQFKTVTLYKATRE